jgi:hypothetical protein
MRRVTIVLLLFLIGSPCSSAGNAAFRDPTSADLAYRATVWVNQTSTHWWKVVTGAWVDQGAITWLPGDASVGVSPQFECGTTALTSNWTAGNHLFDVYNDATATTTTINVVNGAGGTLVPDIATLNSACGSNSCQATTCYDQSGNAANATQATIANAPNIRVVGSQVYFVFSKLTPPPSGSGNYFFNLPSTAWGSSISFFQMSQLNGVIGGYQPAMFELGTATTDFQAYYVKSTSTNSWSDETGVNITASAASTGESNPQVFAMVSGPTTFSTTAYWGERAVANGNWKTKGSPVGGLIGKCVQCTSGPAFLDGTVQAVIIYESALSSANDQLVRLGMDKLFGVSPQLLNYVVVTEGDSEMSDPDHSYYPQYGTTSTTVGGSGYGAMLQAILNGNLNQPVQWINTAISGEQLGQIVTAYPARDAALIPSSPPAAMQIFAFNGGEHEGDSLGDTPSQAFTILQNFYTNQISNGSVTPTPWSAVFYIDMASYNSTVHNSGVTISSGSYNTSTQEVTLTMSGSVPYTGSYYINVSGVTGTGNSACIGGDWTTDGGTSGTTVTFPTTCGASAMTITGGTVSETMEQWRLGGGGFSGFNPLALAGPLTGNTGYVDLGGDSGLGCLHCFSNTANFWTDGIHIGGIGAAGGTRFSNLLYPKLNSILSPQVGGRLR